MHRLKTFLLLSLFTPAVVYAAGYYPMYAAWPLAGGIGSPITLTYSYDNLLDGALQPARGSSALANDALRGAFEAALWDYAAVLPIHFREVRDNGPLPESGEYDPTGLADIRIGQVAHIDGANAYAYFPFDTASGLAGDIVFNAERFGAGWSLTLFYAVAQHELGHALGMGHFVNSDDGVLPGTLPSAYDGPLFPLAPDMISALTAVYGSGHGSISPIPLPPAWMAMSAVVMLYRRRRASPIR